MPTNDERRWLADNMRVFDVVGDGRGRYWLNGTLFGMDISARSEEGLRIGMARLASFIEPDEARLASFIEPDAILDKPDETGRPVSEPEIDRERLLALADEIDRKSDDGTVNPDPMKPIASSLDLFGYAWRIREAVGE